MSSKEKRYETMLFNFGTTSRTDFRDGQIKPLVVTKLKEKPVCHRLRPPPIKDIHTLNEWKTPNIPFELYVKPKEVVHTNPWHVQTYFEKEPDVFLEEVKRTRPRLVMTPAVSLDDIKDPRIRELLIEDVYTTTAQQAMRESASAFPCNNIKAPLPDLPAPPNPIKLAQQKPPYVSPEWRMDSVSWDNSQLRSYAVPTREFWLRRKPPQCTICDQTAEREARRKRLHPRV